MFFNRPGKPTSVKKIIYLLAATILGMFLSNILHAIIEINYLDYLQGQGRVATFYYGCALPPLISFGLLLLGAIGGFFLGRLWWRLVYVDRAWAKK